MEFWNGWGLEKRQREKYGEGREVPKPTRIFWEGFMGRKGLARDMGDENYSIMKNIKSMLSYDFYWYSFVDNFDTVVIWWNLFCYELTNEHEPVSFTKNWNVLVCLICWGWFRKTWPGLAFTFSTSDLEAYRAYFRPSTNILKWACICPCFSDLLLTFYPPVKLTCLAGNSPHFQ